MMAPNENESSQSSNGDEPRIDYWHVWTDQSGISRQTRCVLTHFALKGMSGAAPQWQNEIEAKGATINFSILPVGWVGDWHENPKPQWIIPLSGRWFVETMDGHRVEMGPGDISFGEDQGSVTTSDGRKGHRSGTIGREPAVLMLVQLVERPTVASPCRFK
jgi:hypothetical protein